VASVQIPRTSGQHPEAPRDRSPVAELPAEGDRLGTQGSRLCMTMLNDAEHREIEQRDPLSQSSPGPRSSASAS
jgi:hypothetical protein